MSQSQTLIIIARVQIYYKNSNLYKKFTSQESARFIVSTLQTPRAIHENKEYY